MPTTGLEDHLGSPLLGLDRLAANMRRANLNQFQQFAIDPRLVFPDVEDGLQTAFLQFNLEGYAVDHSPTGWIDQDSAAFDPAESAPIKKMMGPVLTPEGQGDVQAEEIGLHQLVQRQ